MATNSNEKLDQYGRTLVDEHNPNVGDFFIGTVQETNPYNRNSVITVVNGVNAYSQAQSLYKGEGRLTKFIPQPGLNVETSKMPPGKFNPEPPRQYIPHPKSGFAQYGPIAKSDRHPKISPEASGIETSTVHDACIHTTWRDLKRELNRGMGVRTNKYLLEFDIPLKEKPGPAKLNILCQSATFPEWNMNVASLWRFGRKYNLRGEIDYGNTWSISFLEDSALTLRQAFDRWIIDIDDSMLQDTALNVYRMPKEALKESAADRAPREEGKHHFFNYLDGVPESDRKKSLAWSLPDYQTDIRVYQLDQTGNKVAGYLMQNAFVSHIDSVTYADNDNDKLVQYNVTLTYSEFAPMANITFDDTVRVEGFERY